MAWLSLHDCCLVPWSDFLKFRICTSENPSAPHNIETFKGWADVCFMGLNLPAWAAFHGGMEEKNRGWFFLTMMNMPLHLGFEPLGLWESSEPNLSAWILSPNKICYILFGERLMLYFRTVLEADIRRACSVNHHYLIPPDSAHLLKEMKFN